MFVLNEFIGTYVTKREASMFNEDIEENREELSKKIIGKKVLVIGGAGSIGSSFVKSILPYRPSTVVVVDINENALAELARDIRSTSEMIIPKDFITYPMDYASPVFEKMFRKRGGFDIVSNFSAHKHVRTEKDIYSVEALLRNNVLNAKKLLDLLSEYPPEEYFCVSTDKAANPVNIMGASKRIMEDLIFSYSNLFPVKTARFANVAFSNGSLPDAFLSRIQKRQPLSAPCDIKRFFVSLEESGQICMLACMLGGNREIFFPKLKEDQMMSFDYIANALLKELGYKPLYCLSDKDAIDKMKRLERKSELYPVHYSFSDTSGEKAYEEFYTVEEKINLNRFRSLGIIEDKDVIDQNAIFNLLERLDNALNKVDVTKQEIVLIIKEYLPNFEHIETGKSLDNKM